MEPTSSPSSDPAAPDRILVRGLNWLGDAVMSTPALLRLREAHPRARITLLTPAKLADLFQAHPAVDAVQAIAPGEGLWSIARRLRREKPDLGLILPNSPRSALELWLGQVPHRIGVARGVRNLLLTTVVPPLPESTPMIKRSLRDIRSRASNRSLPARISLPARAHQIHHYLHLAAAVGASPEPLPPCITVSEAQMDSARAQFGLADIRWFGLNPGAEYGPAKRWPAERFAAVAAAAQRKWNCRWAILGGPGDVVVAENIARQIVHAIGPDPAGAPTRAPLVLAGRTSLRELCAVLKVCAVVLTNDTGPMHLAAAVGTPVVVPFGSTSPELTGPGLPGAGSHALIRVHAPCAPCFRRICPIDFRCMLEIDPEMVLAGLARVLESSRFPT